MSAPDVDPDDLEQRLAELILADAVGATSRALDAVDRAQKST